LARFVASGRALELQHDVALAHPTAMPANALYPPPHSPRFDFDATAAGSEWIDALAQRAREVLAAVDPDPAVLVHRDWRIENVAVTDDRVSAVYDWDSVCVEPETHAVATAAATFCVDWDRPAREQFPTAAEMRAFVAEYETARGADFDDAQRGVLAARVVYGLCYGARCERAVGHPQIDDSQQGLLRRLGAPLLELGLAALDG
jgi:aminoglycoside phosphotransferase (APT) family kinase protein